MSVFLESPFDGIQFRFWRTGTPASRPLLGLDEPAKVTSMSTARVRIQPEACIALKTLLLYPIFSLQYLSFHLLIIPSLPSANLVLDPGLITRAFYPLLDRNILSMGGQTASRYRSSLAPESAPHCKLSASPLFKRQRMLCTPCNPRLCVQTGFVRLRSDASFDFSCVRNGIIFFQA